MEPPSRRPSVFISYRREDTAGYAGHLNESLARWLEGWRLFFDVGSIQPGWEFGRTIEHAVHHADALIALIGPRWLGPDASRILEPDDFVRVEVAAGLAAGIPVIPVLVQDARLPAAAQLPDELRPLLRKQAIALRDETWRQDVERLARSLRQLVHDDRPRVVAPDTPPPHPPPIATHDVHADEAPIPGEARTGATLLCAIQQSVRAHPLRFGVAIAGSLVVALVVAFGLGVDGSNGSVGPPVVAVPVRPTSVQIVTPPVDPKLIGSDLSTVVAAGPGPTPGAPTTGVSAPPAKPDALRLGTRRSTTGESSMRRSRPPLTGSAPEAGRATTGDARSPRDCREPRRTKNVEAIAPADTAVRGDVRVRYQVDERGHVRSAEVINSDRRRRQAGLEEAALDAVRRREFEPMAKGCPPWMFTVIIEF